MEVFRDPVMTPSGLSYERSALMEHLRKVGTLACFAVHSMTTIAASAHGLLEKEQHYCMPDHAKHAGSYY